MPRYLRLLFLQFRLSLTLGAAYRWDFVLQGALSLVWTALGIVPLYVALHDRPPVEGWSYEQALVVVVLYSIWILAVSLAFWVVRLDNLSYLFNSLLDFGRWPVGIFKGFVRLFFTVVIPIALMTTYPAEALLGRLSTRTAALGVLG